MECKNCKNTKCVGFYLLHTSEMYKLHDLKSRHSDCDVIMIDSPSSGEIYTRFKELHIIEK